MKKNTNKKNLYGKANYDSQVVTLIKITVGVLIILAIVYLITALLTGEIKLKKSKYTYSPTSSTIQYEELVAGQVLNRNDDAYYVMLYDFADPDATLYLYLKDSYTKKDDSLNVYIVDTGKSFNSSIIATDDETYKEKPSKLSELKVKETVTLLEVKKGKVTKRVENKEKVLEFLKKMI